MPPITGPPGETAEPSEFTAYTIPYNRTSKPSPLSTTTPQGDAVDPMIARAMINILQAAIILYELRAEPGSIGGPRKICQVKRENYWKRRLAAARALAHLARRLGDLHKMYSATCTGVGLLCKSIISVIVDSRLQCLAPVLSPPSHLR